MNSECIISCIFRERKLAKIWPRFFEIFELQNFYSSSFPLTHFIFHCANSKLYFKSFKYFCKPYIMLDSRFNLCLFNFYLGSWRSKITQRSKSFLFYPRGRLSGSITTVEILWEEKFYANCPIWIRHWLLRIDLYKWLWTVRFCSPFTAPSIFWLAICCKTSRHPTEWSAPQKEERLEDFI